MVHTVINKRNQSCSVAFYIFKVTGSKVEPASDHDVAQLDHGKNMCAKFELLPAYGHRDLARTKWLLPPPVAPAWMKIIPTQL